MLLCIGKIAATHEQPAQGIIAAAVRGIKFQGTLPVDTRIKGAVQILLNVQPGEVEFFDGIDFMR